MDNKSDDKNIITYFAKTNFRNERTSFGIKKRDRVMHTYIIGKTGTGKTTLQENMTIQDIRNGEGVGVIDPHGTFAEKMLDYVPKERIKDVIYFDPSDLEHPIALNIMEDVDGEQRHLLAAGLMGVFKKMWPDVWSARMEYILNNSILALLEYPDSTLLGINRMLSDKIYRKAVVDNVKDPVIKAFWEQEFASYTDRFAAEATPAIQNKVGQFTTNPLIRNIIGQPKSSFDFRKAMDEKKIIIMNLSKGRIGDQNSFLLGAMLVTKIYLAAMSRAKDSSIDYPPFYLYVDEFQNFAVESFANILSESRKYGLALILAHQYIKQMPEEVSDAVFGNVGTHIIFRVGSEDAKFLEVEFAPEFTTEDMSNLGFANIYLKLLIDGVPSRPFSAETLPPLELNKESYKKEIMDFSRETYCNPRNEIEGIITEWHGPDEESKKESKATDDKEQPKLYEAACSVCGKKTVVPFEPDGKRPIFCQKHRSYIAEDAKVLEDKSPENEPDKEPEVEKTNSDPVSLRSLDEKTTGFRKDFHKKKEKTSPDFKGLRELLAEAGVTKEVLGSEQGSESEKPSFAKPACRSDRASEDKQNILKPGDSVKFQ